MLGGCQLRSTTQDLGQCKMRAFDHFTPKQMQNFSDAGADTFVQDCMEAKGYVISQHLPDCPRGDDPRAQWPAWEAQCYVPPQGMRALFSN